MRKILLDRYVYKMYEESKHLWMDKKVDSLSHIIHTRAMDIQFFLSEAM